MFRTFCCSRGAASRGLGLFAEFTVLLADCFRRFRVCKGLFARSFGSAFEEVCVSIKPLFLHILPFKIITSPHIVISVSDIGIITRIFMQVVI